MAKKTLNLDNPAMQFISTPIEERAEAPKTATTGKAPIGYKPNPLYIEKRSKRVQLLMQPSLHEKVKAKAEQSGCSINDLIHNLLEELTKGE